MTELRPARRPERHPVRFTLPRPGWGQLNALLVASALLAAGAGAAQVPTAIKGQITFFNDSGAFLLDLGNMGVGRNLAGKLSGVEVRPGAGDFVRKSIPVGALVSFTLTKKGAYPEGHITYAGRDLGQWLISRNLATALPKGQ